MIQIKNVSVFGMKLNDMDIKERIIRIVIAFVFGILAIFAFSSCAPKAACPTYNNAVRAKIFLIKEKRGGELHYCYYRPSLTKKEIKRSRKISNSTFCSKKRK